MKIHIKDLKGGERVNQLFNGYDKVYNKNDNEEGA